jgi:hypothetical protein
VLDFHHGLLAAAGGAVGFAVSQTRDAALDRTHSLLGCALLAWALSFYLGCRHLAYVNSSLYSNAELLRVQSGDHPEVGQHPQVMAAASQGIRQALESNSQRASRLGHWQFRLLVAGGVLYVAWHVWRMYLRAAGYQAAAADERREDRDRKDRDRVSIEIAARG